MTDICAFLQGLGIAYTRTEHPAVFTVEEADRLVPPLPGAKTKNLFLRDDKAKNHFLVVVQSDRSVDLRALSDALGVRKLGFGSPDRLKRLLGIDPGSVTVLAVVNDGAGAVKVVVDAALWRAEAIQCHPLVNTATLVIRTDGIRKFLEATRHDPIVMDVPISRP